MKGWFQAIFNNQATLFLTMLVVAVLGVGLWLVHVTNGMAERAYLSRFEITVHSIAQNFTAGIDHPADTAGTLRDFLVKDPNWVQLQYTPLPNSNYALTVSITVPKRLCPGVVQVFAGEPLPKELSLLGMSPRGESECDAVEGDNVTVSAQWLPTGYVNPYKDLTRIH